MIGDPQSFPSVASPDLLPPRRLPWLYFGAAHLCLALAVAVVAVDPRSVAGFYYHPRMLAVVHLVTLGWISLSILGALYIVGPLALRAPLPAGRGDTWAWGASVVGVSGIVSHFWIDELSGMAYSAVLVMAGFAWVGGRVVRSLWTAPVPTAVKAHVVLAFANVLLAALFGLTIGIDKLGVVDLVPGDALRHALAHAHLAGIGWATMVAVGVGYRLFPMVLPAAMPTGAPIVASAILLEAGALGLFVGLATGAGAVVRASAGATLAGIGVFLSQVIWMRRHRRPAPPARPSPEFGSVHALLAVAYLGLSAGCGLVLSIAPPSAAMLRLASVYGVFALLGFLGQLIVGMESRLLPLHAWYWAFADSGWTGPVRSPHDMPSRPAQRGAFLGWLVGVPGLAAGFYVNVMPLIAASAAALLVGVALSGVNGWVVASHAFWGRPSRAFTAATSDASSSSP
ncbi:MAG: hypothetical protein QGF21_00620 [Vicinamibacterales bacterium]|nr:hypothetical protein [Vicinamibacterales bacterium]MDP7670428.1 hypothetical protein [Vicinamibacterales bacterium]HJO38086.1 hypothetical protein [Vicinamibacterales bacterium]